MLAKISEIKDLRDKSTDVCKKSVLWKHYRSFYYEFS